MELSFIFGIIILIISVVIHEVSHGYVALMWGDPTAKIQGRLSLNPFRHLDILGSLIIPAITLLAGGIIFGWAKPVLVNPYNMRNKRWGEFWTAAAGPISNILIATLFGVIIRFFGESISSSFLNFSLVVIYTNIVLSVFNLMPIPPLDGSKMIFNLFPSLRRIERGLEGYYILILFIFIFFLWGFIAPIIPKIVSLIIGI